MAQDVYRAPIYNLKAVVEATDVTDDALRAWERRYGLPEPERTDAGHRIYSQRDIDIVKWLVARQEEGLRIGRAVKLWRSLVEQGQDPLRAMSFQSERLRLHSGVQVARLREEWVSSCLAYDERRAERALDQAFALHPPETVCSEIIREGIAEIGRRWYRGEATAQQEHFASHLAMRRIKTLLSAAPPPTRRGRLLVACPPGERHVIGPFILALLLRWSGWDVIYLGPDVPLRHMEQTLDEIGPDLVILAAQQLHTAGTLLEVACSLHQKDVAVAFGGGVFNRLPRIGQRIPAHYLGPTLEQAGEAVEAMIAGRLRIPRVTAQSEVYGRAESHYRDHQLSVQARAWEHLKSTLPQSELLREINSGFSGALLGALRLGELDLMGEYLAWLGGLHDHTEAAVDAATILLEAYHRAAQVHLDEPGGLIVHWLEEQVAHSAEGDTEIPSEALPRA